MYFKTIKLTLNIKEKPPKNAPIFKVSLLKTNLVKKLGRFINFCALNKIFSKNCTKKPTPNNFAPPFTL